MSDFVHELHASETRSQIDRELSLFQSLAKQVAHAQQNSLAFAEILRDVNAASINNRQALAHLPVTRKSELLERQQSHRLNAGDAKNKDKAAVVFGGFATQAFGAGVRRVFASPGPIYEPEGAANDYWHMARALSAAGFKAGELIHNSFSYHFTPAGSMMETGAHALGCTVFPAGTGQTELQVQAMLDLQPAGYVGTPSYLKIILEKAQDMGVAIPSLTKALVSGEACPASLRDWFTQSGLAVYQCYATADLGLIAYETSAREGLVVDESVIVEIVRPGTDDLVPEGEVGELVVTSLNPDYPLIRFGTGDLSAVLPGNCPTGRTNTRIKGWMGRADQTTKIRGMFVHPSQVNAIAKRFPEVLKARLVVSGEMADDEMTLRVESDKAIADDVLAKISEAIRDVTKLRGTVEWLTPGSLPNDGRVIEDARSYK